MRPDTPANMDDNTCDKNVKRRQVRDLRWGKKRPDTPMVNDTIKLEWRQTHPSDPTTGEISSASICSSDNLEQELFCQKLETTKKLTLRPPELPTHGKSSSNPENETTKRASRNDISKKWLSFIPPLMLDAVRILFVTVHIYYYRYMFVNKHLILFRSHRTPVINHNRIRTNPVDKRFKTSFNSNIIYFWYNNPS